jgi:ABC-type transporter Mla maintaining outer membrane lipid asymmetry ATPase subunit MlaF
MRKQREILEHQPDGSRLGRLVPAVLGHDPAVHQDPPCRLALDPRGDTQRRGRANTDFGITLFVIEHNMRVIMNMADRVHCLAHGELLASGPPEDIQNDQRVIDAYLGAH